MAGQAGLIPGGSRAGKEFEFIPSAKGPPPGKIHGPSLSGHVVDLFMVEPKEAWSWWWSLEFLKLRACSLPHNEEENSLADKWRLTERSLGLSLGSLNPKIYRGEERVQLARSKSGAFREFLFLIRESVPGMKVQ